MSDLVELDRFTPLNFIGNVWEPHYNGFTKDPARAEVYIDKESVRKSKYDIRLRFSKVNDTSEFAGDWFIPRKTVMAIKKTFVNNGLPCYVVPWSKFSKLKIKQHSLREVF